MSAQILDGTTLWVLRRDDMLTLQISFTNLTKVDDPSGSSIVIVTDSELAAHLTVSFPPQAVLEEVLRAGQNPPAEFEVSNAQFSGPSRLVLTVGPGSGPIPYSAAGLLGWTGLVSEPAATALECVWGVVLRPVFWPQDVWVHGRAPDTTAHGVTALWHTHLARRDATGEPDFTTTEPMTLRAFDTGVMTPAFPTPLGDGDRAHLATATAVAPLVARDVLLSPLGATIDVSGQWSTGDLLSYRHRAVLGRDEHVATVSRGYLLPFGFPVQLSTDTRRIGQVVDGNFGAAALYQVSTLVILDPDIGFPDMPGLPSAGRQFPLRSVRVHDTVTEVHHQDNSVATGVTWINAVGSDPSPASRYPFHLSAEDYAGNTVTFTAAMYFVDHDVALTPASAPVTAAVTAYDAEQRLLPRPAAGRIALVPQAPHDTMVDLTAVYLGALAPETGSAATALAAAGHLGAFPRLAGLDARIPAIDALSPDRGSPDTIHGADAVTPAEPELVLAEDYVAAGLTGAGVYAQLNRPRAFLPPVAGGGGLASLNVPVVGLSRSSGLLGGPGKGQLDALEPGFDPAKFFPPSDAAAQVQGYLPPKLLGFIDLAKIVAPAGLGDGDRVPRITTELLYDTTHTDPTLQAGPLVPPLPSAVRSSLTWQPAINADQQIGVLKTTSNTSLQLSCTTTVALHDAQPPASDVRGELRSFDLDFIDGLVVVAFDRLAFSSHVGAPPSLDVKIANITAGSNALQFFQQLLANLPDTSTAPQIAYRDNSLVASYTLAIPAIPLGAFLMQNLAVASSVTLPLDGRPVEASLAFASREHPFLVTVSLFGGGGFLALRVATDSIKELEVQLDFGAAASLDLVVASASVAITAGIHLAVTDGTLEIDAFFRATGHLDVLGLISLTLEIYLALEFQSGPPKRFSGTAEVTVRVRVLFFSQSLSFTVSRSFSAGDDPTFEIAFPTPQPWQQRCAAYAPMAVAR